jgi:D-alanyl-D-alanine dipeptidase
MSGWQEKIMVGFFGSLERFRGKAIPSLIGAQERRKGYRDYRIDEKNHLFNEPLVDVSDFGIEGKNFYNRTENPPYYESIPGSLQKLRVRRSVARRLKEADIILRENGLRLHLHDALRPIEIQKHFHDVWMPAQIRKEHPELSDAQVLVEVEKYWAAPSASEGRPAPHATGAAVDLTLYYRESNEPLYMGSIFDDVSDLAHTDYFELQAIPARYSDVEARANRRILYWTMSDAGFANNPNEWWHFSWGDQMWAKLTDEPAAHYGLARLS